MPSEKKEYNIEVDRVEKGIEGGYKFIFRGGDFPEYSLELKDIYYYGIFRPGEKYVGVFEISGSPDFLGEEDSWENACTISYSLEKIIHKDTVVWKKE